MLSGDPAPIRSHHEETTLPTERSFVGRGRERAALSGAWRAARAGHPTVVGVTGPAGIGKTRLVEEFVRDLGTPPIWLDADENEVDLPWEILQRLVAALPDARAADQALDPQANPVLVGQALADDLIRGDGPVVLVVDDAHWADRPSLEALRYALRRLRATPVLTVLVHHPAETVRRIPDGRANPGLSEGWRRLLESDRGVAVALDGLPADDLMRLAAGLGRPGLSPASAARLHQLTDGNPLHVRHLLPQLPMRALAGDHGPLPAPRGVATTIASQLASCRAPTRDLISAAAVLGQQFRLADAATIAEMSDPTTLRAAAGEAIDAGLVVEVPGGGELAFVDRLTRSSLYHDRALSYRQELHRRAAELGRAGALDHRLAAAAGGTDPAVADEAEQAATQRWRRGEVTAAASLYRHALELTPRGPERAARVLRTVEALLVAGDAAAARDYEADVLAAAEQLPTPWADYVAGYQLLLGAQLPEAKECFERALAAVRQGPLPAPAPADLHARVATQLAIIGIVMVSYEEMVTYGAEAVAAGTTEPWVAAFASFAHAIGLTLSGNAADALVALKDSPDAGLDGLVARGMIELWTDRVADAEADLAQAVRRATAGEALRVGQALGFLGEAQYRRGRLDDAIFHAELALGDAEEHLRIWDYAILHALACYPRAARGEWTAAETHARASAHWAGLIGAGTGFAYAAGARAAIAQARDDLTGLLAAATDIERHYDSLEPGTHLFGPLRADALAQLGRPAEASEALAAYTDRFRATDRRSAQMSLARVRARIALADGDPRTALEAAEQARAHAEAVGLPLEAARADTLAGQCLAGLGRRGPAVARLRAAVAGTRLIGADAYADQATGVATALGLSIDAPDAALDGLTETERAVVRLIGAHRRNKEIATELSISLKTVEGHLSSIYRKLGVSGRDELRALCEDLGRS